jgi:hypothetical protein
MGNRSNINLVGNTTQGQNLGAGDACVFKCKSGGNNLQFRTISSTGSSIQIFQTDEKILISGATGGGITGATNGIGTTSGCRVCLGGILANNTIINLASNSLIFNNGSVISSGATGNGFDSYNDYNISGTTFLCVPRKSFSFGNLALGYQVLNNTSTGEDNTGIGYQVLYNVTTGSHNIGVGCYTLASNTCGSCNIGIGYQVLRYGACGCNNIALGNNALQSTCGCGNVGLGNQALVNNLTGSDNIAIGFEALCCNTTGSYNIALGYYAMAFATGTTNINNIALGTQALCCNTGFHNLALGSESLKNKIAGNYNVAVGNLSLYSNTGGSGNVALGVGAGYNETGSNKLHIGNCCNCSLIYGEFDTKMVKVDGCMCITGLPARSGEGCVVYVDGSGKLSCGPASTGGTGGGIGWSNLTNGSTVAGCGTVASGSTLCDNTIYGVCAASSLTCGDANVAIGYHAFYNGISGCTNIAIGRYAICKSRNDNDNIGIGVYSLMNVSGSSGNVGVGSNTLCKVNVGTYNVAIGYQAGMGITSAQANVAIGNGTFEIGPVTGRANVAIGSNAMCNTQSGNDNFAVGLSSMAANTSGSNNFAFGYYSLSANQTGSNNIVFGYRAGCYITGSDNVGMGCYAIRGTSGTATGTKNIAIGDCTLYTLTSGVNNIAIGSNALYSNTSGGYNIAIGTGTLCGATTGVVNIAIGRYAMSNCIVTGSVNIGIGQYALCNLTSGDGNTVVGHGASTSITTGCYNTAIGQSTAPNITTGCYNIALGSFALNSTGTGCYNIAMGCLSLEQAQTLSNNIAIGSAAGRLLTGGTCNVYIGREAGYNTCNGSGNIMIGTCAGYNTASGTTSNKFVLANCANAFLIKGCFSDCTICNGTNSTAWNTTSDARIKENVVTISCAINTLTELNPVIFDYTENYSEKMSWDCCKRICNYGFVAQEFEQVFPKYVAIGCEKIGNCVIEDIRSINDGHLVPLLVKAIQEQQAQINNLCERIIQLGG